jgi:SAM-dependent methyltransferase
MSGPRRDGDAFRDFERTAHSRIADSYNDSFTAITDRANAPLLDAVKVGRGTRLLDVAAGPGRMTRAAADRGAKATGVDLAPAMVAIARASFPDIDFREASADALPFADTSFDALVCAFGLGHFPDPESVIAEFFRVLAPDGVAALSWWEGFARNRINGIFHETLARLQVSAPPGLLPQGPPMDRFSDPDAFAALLRAAGFKDVAVAPVTFTYRLRDAEELWELAMGSFARASSLIRAQSKDMQRTIRAAVGEAAQQYAQDGGLHIPVAFLVAAGVKKSR